MARVRTPLVLARRTSSAGVRMPSENSVWACRSTDHRLGAMRFSPPCLRGELFPDAGCQRKVLRTTDTCQGRRVHALLKLVPQPFLESENSSQSPVHGGFSHLAPLRGAENTNVG